MSSALQFYISTLLVYLGVSLIACWALNLQLGFTGVLNFAFIVFQAIGAYTAAVLSLGPDTANGNIETYIGGARLPFPLPVVGAAIVGAIAGGIVGAIGLRRLRSDYQAMALLVVSIIATSVAIDEKGIVNGAEGVFLVPQPLSGRLGLSPLGYQWSYVALIAVYCIIAFLVVYRITNAPLGRSLRAVRDHEQAANAMGRNPYKLRLMVMIVGGAIAAVSGAALVEFIGSWGPDSWVYSETFVYFAAVIIGGSGNNLGVMLGALLVPVAFNELPRYIPAFGTAGFAPALEWIVIGLSILGFLYFRPQGIFPEKARQFGLAGNSVRDNSRLAWRPRISPDRESEHAAIRKSRDLQSEPGSSPHGPACVDGAIVQSKQPLLCVENVSRSFGGVQAVNDASFTVNARSITALIGPNGAGKSTMCNLIAGMLRPDRGSIRYDGEEISGRPPHDLAVRGLRRTFQATSEFKGLTVTENLLVGVRGSRGDSLVGALRGRGYWRAEERENLKRVRSLLIELNLLDLADQLAATLSGGQRRLVELMRAVMGRPRMLVLDEPFTGIHPAMVEAVLVAIQRLHDDGVTILMIEHDLGLIERMCDHVVVMANGTVIARGSMEELRKEEAVIDAYFRG